MLDTNRIMSRCSIKLGSSLYPGIYVEPRNNLHLVYVNHLDQVTLTDKVYAYDFTQLKEKVESVSYELLESPAYFRHGTSLCLKWGNSSYIVDSGELIDICGEETVDKITGTIKT